MLKRYKELLAKQAEGTISEDEKTELAKIEADAEETTTEVEVSKSVMDALAKTVGDMVQKEVGDAVAKAIETNEKTVKKAFGGEGTKGAGDITKEQKLFMYIKALENGGDDLAKYKATLTQNEADLEDGGVLVAPAEFVAEVRRLEESYGVAIKNANIRRTNGNKVASKKKTGGVTVSKVGELVKGTSSKMQFANVEITLDKYLGLSIVSSELEEDAVVDIWNQLSIDFAREFAKTQDQIVFTDATSGILNLSGVNSVAFTGASFDDVTFDALSLAIDGVPTPSANNGKFYMHRTVKGILNRVKDLEGRYVIDSKAKTLWDYPYELVEVMPTRADSAQETPFIVFGDLKQYDLVIKNQMGMEILNQGIVETGDGEVNLIQQDAKAIRARQRMAGEAIFENAFSVISTGTGVS